MASTITLGAGIDTVAFSQGPILKINGGASTAWNDQTIDGGTGIGVIDTLTVDESSTKSSYFSLSMSHDGIVTFTSASGSNSKYVSITNFEKIVFWDVTMNLGTAGNDSLTGSSSAENIYGFDGNDTIDGGLGADKMFGGAGDDTFVVNVLTDLVTELTGEGIDTVNSAVTYSLADTDGAGVNGGNVENLILTGAGAINGTGNALNNVLTGNGVANTLTGDLGNDTLDGGLGNDSLAGGADNDTYIVDSLLDVVTELVGGGTDTIKTGITFSLVDTDGAGANGGNVENLTLTGSAAIDGTGNDLNNVIVGNSAVNTLNGGLGNDTLNGGLNTDIMIGGGGNDIYYVDQSLETVTELAGGGKDSVKSSVTFALSANVENLTLTGKAAINGTGTTGANVIVGNAGANVITGGRGRDTLTGGAGADTFDYNSVLESAATAAHDLIKDFVHLVDRIDLSTIDANGAGAGNGAFSFLEGLGTAFTGAVGQVHFITSGANTLIEGDVNGDTIADFQIVLAGTVGLTGLDFIL